MVMMTKGKMIALGAIGCAILVFGIVSTTIVPSSFRTIFTYGFVFLLVAALSAVKRYFPATIEAKQDVVDLVVSRSPQRWRFNH
jgi:hypothetical protein